MRFKGRKTLTQTTMIIRSSIFISFNLKNCKLFCYNAFLVLSFPISDGRLENLLVGLSDTDPASVTPVLNNYDVCTTYPGPAADGAVLSLDCTQTDGLTGRYVIIQLQGTNYLTLCEVEVFDRK